MATKILLIGFDLSKPEDAAVAEALEEYAEAAEREGRTVVGTPDTTVVRDDPERTAMGEYAVAVVGEWSDGN
jgi:hypothetical protein